MSAWYGQSEPVTTHVCLTDILNLYPAYLSSLGSPCLFQSKSSLRRRRDTVSGFWCDRPAGIIMGPAAAVSRSALRFCSRSTLSVAALCAYGLRCALASIVLTVACTPDKSNQFASQIEDRGDREHRWSCKADRLVELPQACRMVIGAGGEASLVSSVQSPRVKNKVGEMQVRMMVGRKRKRILSGKAMANVVIVAAAIVGVIAASSSPSLAFGGCTQASPENPSAILALLGGAAAALPVVRARFKSRSRK